MKKTYIVSCDQNKITHLPVLVVETTFEDICRVDPDFKSSVTLKSMFASKDVQEILITLYVPKGEVGQRRRIAGIRQPMSDKEAKDLIANTLRSLDIEATFHDSAEFRKIIPFKREDRELLKAVLGGASWPQGK